MPTDDRPGDPRSEWQGQPTPDFRMAPALLERRASASRRRLRRLGIAQYAGGSAGLVASAGIAMTVDGRLLRTGAALMALLFAWVLLLLHRAPRGRDDGSIAAPLLESYRAELERHRWLFSGYRLWSRLVIGIPVATVVCLGLARSQPARARLFYLELAAIAAGLGVTCVVAHRRGRRYQQEIDELDALRR